MALSCHPERGGSGEVGEVSLASPETVDFVILSREDGEGSLRHVHGPAPDPSPSSRLRMTQRRESISSKSLRKGRRCRWRMRGAWPTTPTRDTWRKVSPFHARAR